MHLAKSILLLLGGAVAGITFVISCGDNLRLGTDAAIADAPKVTDAPKALDAAPACDCPAAEPPLAGRFVVVSQTQVIPPNARSGQGALCPVGSMAISGSCTLDVVNPVWNVTLEQSGFYEMPPAAWNCFFRNNEPAASVKVRASVICLKPAP